MKDTDQLIDEYFKELNERAKLLNIKTYIYEKDDGVYSTDGLKIMGSIRNYLNKQKGDVLDTNT